MNVAIDPGVVTLIQSTFLEHINVAFSTATRYAFNLLYLFAALELTVLGLAWALQRDTGWSKIFFKIIKIGLIFFIIQNYSWLLNTIVSSFAKLAGIVINNDNVAQYVFNPAKIWKYGYDIGIYFLQLAFNNTILGPTMIQICLGMGILLVFGLLGIQMIVQMVSFYLVSFGALIFFFPSNRTKVIGITGTDGKTTTVNLVHHILSESGKNSSMISTIGAKIGDKTIDTGLHVTTPDPFIVQRLLRKIADAGSEFAVLEVTSHGLAQERVALVRFFAGVITNIAHEHLDYHKSYKNYFLSKAKILNNVRYRILNADEPSFKQLKDLGGGQLVSFGIGKEAIHKAENFNATGKLYYLLKR